MCLCDKYKLINVHTQKIDVNEFSSVYIKL